MSRKLLFKKWPLFVIVLLCLIFFAPFFFENLTPFPGDIVIGLYYPWLDYKWGFPVGVPVKNPLVSDIPSIIFPWRMAVIDSFKNGQWPLWNPAYFLGMPLLANFQSATFSPANFFFLFFDQVKAWGWGVCSQALFLLGATYFFLRTIKLKKIPSLLGAVVFAFSGFAVVWQQYNVHGWTMGFTLLIFLAAEKYRRCKKRKWLLWLSLFTAGQVFSGYLPIVIYTWLALAIWLVFKKASIKIFLAAIFGFTLAAGQLLPGLELIGHSIRKIDPLVTASQAGYLPLKNLVTIFIPDFFGNPATGNFWGTGFYDNYAFWIGPVALFLAGSGIFNSRNKKKLFVWLIIAASGFLLAIKNPIGLFLEKIFFLKGGVASRSLFLVDFALAVLAGFGLQGIMRVNFKKVLGQFLIFVALLLLISIFPIKQALSTGKFLIAARNSFLPVMTIGVLFLATLFLRRRETRPLFSLTALLLTVFGLWYSTHKYWTFWPPDLTFPSIPTIDYLRENQNSSRFEPADVISQNLWMPYGLETVSGYDTLMPRLQGELLSLAQTGQIQKKISRVHLLTNYDSPFFPMFNVRYLLAKKLTPQGLYSPDGNPPPMFSNPRFRMVFEDKTVQVYEDTTALPRLWWVAEAKGFQSEEVARLMTQSDFSPATTALISSNQEFIYRNLSGAKIEEKERSANKAEYKITTSGLAFVVESAAYYQGWKATLDGKPTAVYQVNHGLRGYFVTAGEHTLRIFYQPLSFQIGLCLSVLSLFLWFILMLWPQKNL